MATRTTRKLATELAALGAQRELIDSARGREALEAALAGQDVQALVAAARAIEQYTLAGFADQLRGRYRALAGERAGSLDAGCVAKAALIAALDALEDHDGELFAHAACYEQLERTKSGLRDTASSVRTRGVLGLARLGHAELLCILGRALGDRDATVRLSAARALAHRGHRDGAGLLLLRLGAGDDTPDVRSESLRALFAIASDWAVRYVRTALRDAEGVERERLLHALGTANDDASVELLQEQLASASLSDERAPVIESIGLSLRPRARALLLELVASERSSDAEAALAALSIHRYDERLVAELGDLTASSPTLHRSFREQFQRAE